MSLTNLRRAALASSAALLLMLPSCGTSHLMRWSNGEASDFTPIEDDRTRSVVVPAGTVLMLPVTVVWDVATFPFQWIWGIYPYGHELDPDREG